jgi:hypothetical protein
MDEVYWWTHIHPMRFTSPGTKSGIITVSYTGLFNVGQNVLVRDEAGIRPDLLLSVVSIISATQVLLGPRLLDPVQIGLIKNGIFVNRPGRDLSGYGQTCLVSAHRQEALYPPPEIAERRALKSFLLLEGGGLIVLEDNSGRILLE